MKKNNKVVYVHKKKTTGEIFYVGIGNERRPRSKERTDFWHKVANKHGVIIEILRKNLSWEEASDIEIELIKYHGKKSIDQGTLVNMTDGGDGNNGLILSDETKHKMSLAKLGTKQSKETIKNKSWIINQLTLDGEFIKQWPSIKEAARQLDLHATTISAAIKGVRRKSHGGFRWERV
tara:strand:- start:50 stop:583 length:534 start_codon:yes stop_codon:yes gene_type:complete